MKTQSIRLIDVFFLGPAMIYFGLSGGRKSKLERVFLIVSGAATIAYNFKNYQTARELEEQALLDKQVSFL